MDSEILNELLEKLKITDYKDIDTILNLARKIEKERMKINTKSSVRIAVIASYSIQYFVMVLKAMLLSENIDTDIYEGKYDGINMEILSDKSELYKFAPDIVIILTNYTDIKKFPNLLESDEEVKKQLELDINYYKNLWNKLSENNACHIFQTNFAIPIEREVGNLEANYYSTKTNYFNLLNLELLKERRKNVNIIDVEYFSSYVGKKYWFDYGGYYLAKLGFNMDFLGLFSQIIVKQIQAVLGIVKKCLVIDLDNTIWGGVVGDDGINGIILDPNNPIGEAFRNFQRYIKQLKDRGVILAVCSKNNEEIVKEVFAKNEFMILKPDDISYFAVNWNDKASNIIKIANDLNIGIDSMVFFDDNPAERAIVSKYLPKVTVINVPDDPSEYIRALEEASPFEWIQITKEDFNRSETYIDDAKRKLLKDQIESYDEYLKMLKMKVKIHKLNENSKERFVQLINKTNQFNVRTKRYNENEINQMQLDKNKILFTISLEDIYSNYGIISNVILEFKGKDCFIDTWVMSCRVFKRNIEYIVLNKIIEIAKLNKCTRILGEYIPTEKNKVIKDLFKELGFERYEENEGNKERELYIREKFELNNIFEIQILEDDYKT